jgi:microcystin-dependent protein
MMDSPFRYKLLHLYPDALYFSRGSSKMVINPPSIQPGDLTEAEAPVDGKQYGRQNAAWSEVIHPDATGQFLPIAGGIMAGGINWGESAYTGSSADDISQALGFYDSSANGNDLGISVTSGSLNLVAVHNENRVTARVGLAQIAQFDKTGLRISKGTVTLLNDPAQPLEAATKRYVDAQLAADSEPYLPLTGGKVTGELEVEGDLHIHGDHNVDTPKLIIKDQDSDERYLLRTEYVPPTGGTTTSATIGDVKSGFQPADHAGWIVLNGRSTTELNAAQQANATSLGFTTNLPDAFGAVPIQNGGIKGAISGSMTRTLTTDQMPAHHHTARCCINDQGVHGFGDLLAYYSQPGALGVVWRGSAEICNDDNGNLAAEGRMMSDTGNSQPFDITPKSIAVNYFVYLGA